MSLDAWQFEYAVTCEVPPDFAWAFWSDVRNWTLDADVESVELDGPFVSGARGVTHSRSSGRIEWSLCDVTEREATFEFRVPGALMKFFWRFFPTRSGVEIRQQASLSGEQVSEYLDKIAPALEQGIPAGMARLCEAIRDAYVTSRSTTAGI